MSEPKFKFTKDMVNERFIKMIQAQPGQATSAKPNVIEELKAKAGLNRIRNGRT